MISEYNFEAVIIVLDVFLLLWLWRVLKVTFVVEHAVGGAQNDELGAAVELVAYLLLLLVAALDELLAEHVALFEPCVALGEFLTNGLWLLLSVTHRRETVLRNAMCDEVVDHRLSPSL